MHFYQFVYMLSSRILPLESEIVNIELLNNGYKIASYLQERACFHLNKRATGLSGGGGFLSER
jgi:hypothetical protein